MNDNINVQLLYFPGCPNVEATRKVLIAALENLSLGASEIKEVNVHDPKTVEHLRNYPSPTILINGRDIEDIDPNNAAACRLYDGQGGVPREEKIEAFIKDIIAQS